MTNGSEAALRAYVDRIMRVMDEGDRNKEDLKELYTEIKSAGFDVKLLREAVALRRKFENAGSFEEYMAAREAYLDAVGLVRRFEPDVTVTIATPSQSVTLTGADVERLNARLEGDHVTFDAVTFDAGDVTWNEPMDGDDEPDLPAALDRRVQA